MQIIIKGSPKEIAALERELKGGNSGPQVTGIELITKEIKNRMTEELERIAEVIRL